MSKLKLPIHSVKRKGVDHNIKKKKYNMGFFY